ncbi:hypothetical protein HAX54_047179 [Datura stramonium]|uniref:Uncharacterized protein n=1 Tax=Datura stramonium TaxID=4076 RepID=A0ABS8SS31_DATST|nr:hypothetical protein [Datura stramonium]
MVPEPPHVVVDGRGAVEDGPDFGGVGSDGVAPVGATVDGSSAGVVPGLEAHRGTSVDLTKRSSLPREGTSACWQRLVTRHGYGGLECTVLDLQGQQCHYVNGKFGYDGSNQYGPVNGECVVALCRRYATSWNAPPELCCQSEVPLVNRSR